jgi:predicted nucleic acid-binding protein
LSFLLDTNVVSELRKANRDQRVSSWFEQVESSDIYLSVLVAGEVRQGIERLRRRGDAQQAEIFERWLKALKDDYADRILAISTAVAERWGRLNAAKPLPVIDGLLAATAIEHDLTLVTRDSVTLEASGARLLNPWQS